MKRRLWVCPECDRVYAINEDYTVPSEVSPEGLIPTCSAHTEHWPDGIYTRSVSMLKTDTVVTLELSAPVTSYT